jgi:hypothetical protein
MFKRNEYKVSIMRNFGTEQVSCTGTVYSYNTNPEKATKEVLKGFHAVIDKAFKDTVERHDLENKFIAARTKAIEQMKKDLKEQANK